MWIQIHPLLPLSICKRIVRIMYLEDLVIKILPDPLGAGLGTDTPIPPSLFAGGMVDDHAAFTWKNNMIYAFISVEQKQDAGAFIELARISGILSSYSTENLDSGSYQFRIRSLIAGTWSSYSNIVSLNA